MTQKKRWYAILIPYMRIVRIAVHVFDQFHVVKLMNDNLDEIRRTTQQAETAKVEGINNKIKVMKRNVYGFRDDKYF